MSVITNFRTMQAGRYMLLAIREHQSSCAGCIRGLWGGSMAGNYRSGRHPRGSGKRPRSKRGEILIPIRSADLEENRKLLKEIMLSPDPDDPQKRPRVVVYFLSLYRSSIWHGKSQPSGKVQTFLGEFLCGKPEQSVSVDIKHAPPEERVNKILNLLEFLVKETDAGSTTIM